MYDEKYTYYDRLKGVSPYTKGYLDSIIETQMKVYGCYFIDELLTDDIMKDIERIIPYHKNKDGIETLTQIRKDKNIPVILLSAKSEDIDKIHGLNLGADDYITKPFNPAELIARVNALLRRYTNFETEETNNKNIIKNGGLIINDDLKKVTIDGKEIKLTPTEYNILKFLTENKGKVYSIEDIYQNVWKDDYFASDNVIAVHIRHIREKIEINPKEPRYLKVIWGVGYKVECL